MGDSITKGQEIAADIPIGDTWRDELGREIDNALAELRTEAKTAMMDAYHLIEQGEIFEATAILKLWCDQSGETKGDEG